MSEAGSAPAVTCVAVDIGATKVEAALVDASGAFLRRERIATSPGGDLFERVAELVERMGRGESRAPVGVACAGPLSSDSSLVSPLNIPEWRDFPLRERLGDALGRPVEVDGDVRVRARAEGRVGAAQGLDDFLSLVVSSGIGGALVLDGRLVEGRTGNAGHVGHLIVVPNGRPCACGSRGCLEAEASGLALEHATGDLPERASAPWRDRVADLVGSAVGTLAAVMDFERCFVGGSVALGYGRAFFTRATAAARSVAGLEYARAVRLEATGLGADGGLIGAALLAREAKA